MRLKTEWSIAGGLELLAIVLAQWQALGGVRTDEAKYLLSIPYPHPPFLRTVISWTEFLPFQEMFWRLLLATLMVQAVWLLWDMTRSHHLEDRMVVCAGWLLSSAVLVQTGSIVLAPVIALMALMLLWLRSRPEIAGRMPALIALFWLAMVMTAYQGVLFLPLAWSVLRRAEKSLAMTLLSVVGPIVLLALWTLSNPLALATMVIHGSDGAVTSLADHLLGTAQLWIVGGAGIVSLVGTYGILRSRDWALIGSLVLVAAYVTTSVPYPFYAVLFTPLFAGGVWALFSGRRHPHAFPILACAVFASAIVTWFSQPLRHPGPAREIMTAIDVAVGTSRAGMNAAPVLIAGFFGHEWQYESRLPIRRYKPAFAQDAAAVVCQQPCEPMFTTAGWRRLNDVPVETWIRK